MNEHFSEHFAPPECATAPGSSVTCSGTNRCCGSMNRRGGVVGVRGRCRRGPGDFLKSTTRFKCEGGKCPNDCWRQNVGQVWGGQQPLHLIMRALQLNIYSCLLGQGSGRSCSLFPPPASFAVFIFPLLLKPLLGENPPRSLSSFSRC